MLLMFPGFGIRLAEDAELPIARFLFPRWYDQMVSRRVNFFLAVSDRPYRIWGGAAIFPLSVPPRECSFRIDIEVIPSCRGRGIGRALLDAAVGLSRTCEADALYTWRDINEEVGTHFLGPAGFKRHGRDLIFEAEISRVLEVYRPLMEHLSVRRKIPAGARMVPYQKADPYLAARLSEQSVSLIPAGHYACQHASPSDKNNRYRCSQALLVDEKLAGVMVAGIDDDRGTIETWILQPSFRGTWANALLSTHTLDLMKREGVRIIRFYCHEDNLHTIRIAKRSDATLLKEGAGYRLAL